MKKISFEAIIASIFIINLVGIIAVPPTLINFGVEYSITAVLLFGFGIFLAIVGGCDHYEKEYWSHKTNKTSKKQIK